MISIESLPANPATTSAKVAQATAVSATDGAPMAIDAEVSQSSAFAAIFQQLSQAIAATEEPPPQPQQVQTTDAPTAPKLPNLPAVPPPAIAKEQQPTQPPPSDTVPTQDVGARHASPSSPPILPLNVPMTDEPVSETDPEEKPQKESSVKCDFVDLPPQVPIQPIDIATPTPPQTDAEAQGVIPESNFKRRPIQLQNPASSKSKEPDEPAPKQIQSKQEAQIRSFEMQIADEPPLPSTEDPSSPTHAKLDSPKPEFTLPQPHTVQKEIDQPAPAPPLPPEQAFIQNNHPKILTAIHGELLPNGGSMHIRLDPPELGALNVQIDVRDGILTASFQTSNDEATRLLSHSLGQLRTTLESAGVSVEKLQVQQAPREHFTSNSSDHERNPRQQAYERSAHDDRQRREMLQRMWRRLTIGRDALDLVA